MSLMTVKEVAAFLGVQEVRVERLERESLLVSKDKDTDGNPLFDSGDVERYKTLAERLGGSNLQKKGVIFSKSRPFYFLREATLVQVTLFALLLLIHVAQRATFKNRECSTAVRASNAILFMHRSLSAFSQLSEYLSLLPYRHFRCCPAMVSSG